MLYHQHGDKSAGGKDRGIGEEYAPTERVQEEARENGRDDLG